MSDSPPDKIRVVAGLQGGCHDNQTPRDHVISVYSCFSFGRCIHTSMVVAHRYMGASSMANWLAPGLNQRVISEFYRNFRAVVDGLGT